MDKNDILQKVISTVVFLTQTDVNVNEHTNLYGDLCVDSLDFLEIEMELEKAFGIDIPIGKLTETSSVGEIVETIYNLQCRTT